jgi:RimJ/RimL family protein N-acetyltransferase
MLRGELAGLRARADSDVPILHAELYDDVATRMRADTRPWRPIPPGSPASPYAMTKPAADADVFSVVWLGGDGHASDGSAGDGQAGRGRVSAEAGELAGEALLWSIDTHNRVAHIGISLRPAFRGRGLGTDVVRVLCYHGFAVRGMHRLQIETLSDNTAMIAAAVRAGFVREGTLRSSAWVDGAFLDETILGLLATEWPGRAR